MFGTAIRYFAKKSKSRVSLKTPPEQTQTITRTIFDIIQEHGPLTIGDTWERVKGVGLSGLTSKTQMKVVLKWMKEKHKLKLICNHVGPHKQFLYSTLSTEPNTKQPGAANGPFKGQSKLSS